VFLARAHQYEYKKPLPVARKGLFVDIEGVKERS